MRDMSRSRDEFWGELGNLLGQLPPLLVTSPDEHAGWTEVLHMPHLVSSHGPKDKRVGGRRVGFANGVGWSGCVRSM